jgi:hypothetical protein
MDTENNMTPEEDRAMDIKNNATTPQIVYDETLKDTSAESIKSAFKAFSRNPENLPFPLSMVLLSGGQGTGETVYLLTGKVLQTSGGYEDFDMGSIEIQELQDQSQVLVRCSYNQIKTPWILEYFENFVNKVLRPQEVKLQDGQHIVTLSERYQIIIDRFNEGWTSAQIASVLKTPEGLRLDKKTVENEKTKLRDLLGTDVLPMDAERKKKLRNSKKSP